MKRALLFSLLIPFLAAQTTTEVEITSEPSPTTLSWKMNT
jgi:hypothetical protein